MCAHVHNTLAVHKQRAACSPNCPFQRTSNSLTFSKHTFHCSPSLHTNRNLPRGKVLWHLFFPHHNFLTGPVFKAGTTTPAAVTVHILCDLRGRTAHGNCSTKIFINPDSSNSCADLEAALVIVAEVDVFRAVPDRGPGGTQAAAVTLGFLRAPVTARGIDHLAHQVHVAQRLPLQGHLHVVGFQGSRGAHEYR